MQLPAASATTPFITPLPIPKDWRAFLRKRPELGSHYGNYAITVAKYKAAQYNARIQPPPPAPPPAPPPPPQRPPVVEAESLRDGTYVRRRGYVYMGQLMDCEFVPGQARCTYTGGHEEWQCFLPATTVHPLGPTQLPLQQLCSLHYVSRVLGFQ
jgi:hypothetical protein